MSIKRETVEERKALPLAKGVLDYFPDALLAVAEVSRVGNEQHHPGQPLHWDKSKSTDEADALLRHLIDRGTRDTDGLRHTAKVAWRALALLQRELDGEPQAEEGYDGPPTPNESLCVCHTPGVPVGDEHRKFVERSGLLPAGLQPLIDYVQDQKMSLVTVREAPALETEERKQAWIEAFFKQDAPRALHPQFSDRPLACYICGATEHTLDCPLYRQWPTSTT
jgi:hypothetical protein